MAPLYPYHASLLELLNTPPAVGGGHRWLYKAALHLRHYHSAEVITTLLREYTATWERQVPELEIVKTVAKAFNIEAGPHQTAIDWPLPDPVAIAVICSRTDPLPLKDFGRTPQECLAELWPPEALLCCGPSQDSAKVMACAAWLKEDLQSMQFIVPSRMRATWGVTQDGRESQRCLTNTGRRQWLVVECDSTTEDQQARILAHLAKVLPLTMVVHSGGKSLHGWFYVEGVDEPALAMVFSRAVQLGADSHTWNRCQWVRMPGGTRPRQDGQSSRQSVLYWRHNPCRE